MKKTISATAITISAFLLGACSVHTTSDEQNAQATPAKPNGGEPVGDATPVKGNGGSRKPTIPDRLVVTAIMESATPTEVFGDNGDRVILFGSNIPETRTDVPINDFLNLKEAASRAIVEPKLGGCKYSNFSLDYLGPANEIFQIGAREPQDSTLCRDFIRSVAKNGMRLTYTDVPLLNGHGRKIPVVEVTLQVR